MNQQWSDEDIYQKVGDIVQEFGLLKCAECAEAIKERLKENAINGTHLKLTSIEGHDFIVSERWDGGRNSISQNGTHYAVEVRGKVFDNLSTTGLSRDNWIKDFTCPSGGFNVLEIEEF